MDTQGRGLRIAGCVGLGLLFVPVLQVVVFYAVGLGMDPLPTDMACERLSCGIGAGFLMVYVALAACLLGWIAVAVAVPVAMRRRSTWGRGLAVVAMVLGVLAALTVAADIAVLVLDDPNPH